MPVNYVFGSMPNRHMLADSIMASIPAIGVATLDEPTFMNYLTNIFHSTPLSNDRVSILRWTIPSGLHYITATETYRVMIQPGATGGLVGQTSPARPIDSLQAMAMIRDLSKKRDNLQLVNINNEAEVYTSDRFHRQFSNRNGISYRDPITNSQNIREEAILVLPDFHRIWHEPMQIRCLKETIDALEGKNAKVILTFPPGTDIPIEIQTQLYVTNFDSPNIDEFENLIYFWLTEQANQISEVKSERFFLQRGINIRNLISSGENKADITQFLDQEDKKLDTSSPDTWTPSSITLAISNLAQALTGLSWTEACHTLLMAYQKAGYLSVIEVQNSKITYLNSHEALSVQSPDKLPGYDEVGGYGAIKDYISRHMEMFKPENRERAKELGLKPFKGCLLVGVPGCGKSLIAKATGRESNMLVVDFDIGKVMNKYVGGSEHNMISSINMLCKTAGGHGVLVIMDEIEKQLAGSSNAGASDAGATSRVHKNFLTWLNDRTEPVIIFATANNIDQIPTEFFRPGRFDAVFFFDLPSKEARREILRVHLNKYKQVTKDIDVEDISDRLLEGFTGAEIEQLIYECVTAILHGESDKIDETLICNLIPEMKLQCNTHREQIARLRERAREFRPAEILVLNEYEDNQQNNNSYMRRTEIVEFDSDSTTSSEN